MTFTPGDLIVIVCNKKTMRVPYIGMRRKKNGKEVLLFSLKGKPHGIPVTQIKRVTKVEPNLEPVATGVQTAD